MRGSVARLNKKIGCGFILGENGLEAYFDLSSLEDINIQALSIEETWNIRNTLETNGCGLRG